MTTLPPLRRMVLFKHGVGYYTRHGTVSGHEIELYVGRVDLDDVLKSLTVVAVGMALFWA